jgi:hypothetical protein
MKRVLLTFCLGFGLNCTAQTDLTGAERLSKEGRYIKITVLFGNPAKIFVGEKERLRIDLSNLKMEVRSDKGDPWQQLKINEYGNYYTVDLPKGEDSSPSLEVRTTLNNKKTESFKFKKP